MVVKAADLERAGLVWNTSGSSSPASSVRLKATDACVTSAARAAWSILAGSAESTHVSCGL